MVSDLNTIYSCKQEKILESDEQEYVSSEDEAPQADQIFQQTSINRLSRPPDREMTVYTPPSTLCVTTDYETSDAQDEETTVASQRASQRASHRSSQLDQTWDDEDGFEEALENMDGMNTSAVSVQTDITDGKVKVESKDEFLQHF